MTAVESTLKILHMNTDPKISDHLDIEARLFCGHG